MLHGSHDAAENGNAQHGQRQRLGEGEDGTRTFTAKISRGRPRMSGPKARTGTRSRDPVATCSPPSVLVSSRPGPSVASRSACRR